MKAGMWKTIEKYEKYEVSRDGYIKNKRTGQILKSRPDKDGYSLVNLYTTGRKGHTQKVHRLVAQAFLPPDPNPERTQINHINGVKADNRFENLEWCTRSENTRHAYANNLLVSNIQPAITAHTKISDRDRREIIRMRSDGIPVKDIAKKYDVSLNTIYEICKKEVIK